MVGYKKLITGLKLAVCTLSLALVSQASDAATLKGKKDGEWVTISGKVTSVYADAFRLKSGKNSIYVEMDDYDWDADGYKLVTGDNVVVRGYVDQDFLEKKKIEASSVYVKNLDTFFYASGADEEDPSYSAILFSIENLPDGTTVDLNGTVESIDGRKMTVNVGTRKVIVDTDSMIFNPLDNRGLVQVDIGDHVKVSGNVDNDYFSRDEVEARYIVDYN